MFERLREREHRSDGKYHGLSAAWRVVRYDYGVVFILFVLGGALALIYLRANPGGRFVYDDSYITLTFARNLLRYGKFTFDGVHASGGATSPLHVVLIALFALITRHVEIAAFLLGALSLQLAGTFAYYWSREVTQSRKIALVSSLLLITSGWMVFDALSGLETVLFLALLLLALFLFEKRSLWFGLPLALCVTTRPDAAFFVAGLAAYVLIRFVAALLSRKTGDAAPISRPGTVPEFSSRKPGTVPSARPWLFGAGIFALVLVPFLIYNSATTGSLLPATGLAKTYFFGEIDDPLPAKLSHFWVGVKFFYAHLVMFWPALVALGLIFARKLWRHYYWLLAAIAFYPVYLWLYPGSTMHYWCRYQHIFIPFLMLAIAEGSFVLVRLLTSWIKDPRAVRILSWALGGFIAVMLSINQVQSLSNERRIYAASARSTEEVGEEVARLIRNHSRPGDVVATHDIGAIAWFSDRPVLDLVGLVNPEVRELYRNPETGKVIPIGFDGQRDVYHYLLERNPTFLVIFADWKRFIGFSPDQDTSHFTFLGESKPPYPSRFGGYRIYGVK